jgi:hypothetical protein
MMFPGNFKKKRAEEENALFYTARPSPSSSVRGCGLWSD